MTFSISSFQLYSINSHCVVFVHSTNILFLFSVYESLRHAKKHKIQVPKGKSYLRFQFEKASTSGKTITLYRSHLKLQKKQPFPDLGENK
ncbi:hypothetical protein RJT34_17360 [Clitoria ternatea]|uniref:Uncharacterized protein n=1 Tax=Clitoria ternatea TaxID=43366 RepID=A0AAN9PDQ6_CLITE